MIFRQSNSRVSYAAAYHKRIQNMWKSVPVLLAATLIAMAAWAQSAGNLEQYLRADHPDSYVVVKGDTLWDIAGKFLAKPWFWPELWRANPQIENPHLIYPGDMIRLVYIDGQPALVLERGEAGRTYQASPSSDEKLSPKIRATPLENPIPAINLDAVQGFLVQNRVVTPSTLDAAPYVIQGESERLVVGGGDRLYVRGKLEDSQSYSFVRKGPLYRDPDTDEVLGQEATYIGLGRVVAQEAEITTFFVSNSREEVQIGDRVLPTEERAVDSTFFPSAPGVEVDGQVIAVTSGVTQVGQFDVVVLDRGERNGLVTGNVLAIYKRGALANDRVANQTIRLPSERAGLLMVFRVFDKLSYALVLGTERPLAVLDEIKNP
jgi:LysM domain